MRVLCALALYVPRTLRASCPTCSSAMRALVPRPLCVLVSHVYIYELTRIQRVSTAFQTHLLDVTHPKTSVLGTFKFIYLANLLSHYLCSNDNLEITVWYQK